MTKNSVILVVGIFALSFFLTGCQTPSAINGAGFELLTPQANTVKYITSKDREFAEQVASNNRACKKSEGCLK